MNMMKKMLLLFLLLATSGVVSAGTPTITYIYTDAQGTPLAEADANGNITATYDYKPYGSQALGSPPSGPGYTGHVNDPDTNFVYMQARYYDPPVGRFLSIDPVVPVAGNAFNFNRFDYGNNNPIKNVDPDGRDSVGENIDQNAQAASDAGNRVAAYGWAFAGVAWSAFGAESLSQVADKGSSATTGDKAGAGLELLSALPPVKIVGKAAMIAEDGAKAAGIVAKDGTKITGFTKHGVDRAVGDAGKRAGTKPAAILDALKNPGKVKEGVDSQGRAFKVYTGENARVVVNPETGKVISTNPLSRNGSN